MKQTKLKPQQRTKKLKDTTSQLLLVIETQVEIQNSKIIANSSIHSFILVGGYKVENIQWEWRMTITIDREILRAKNTIILHINKARRPLNNLLIELKSKEVKVGRGPKSLSSATRAVGRHFYTIDEIPVCVIQLYSFAFLNFSRYSTTFGNSSLNSIFIAWNRT